MTRSLRAPIVMGIPVSFSLMLSGCAEEGSNPLGPPGMPVGSSVPSGTPVPGDMSLLPSGGASNSSAPAASGTTPPPSAPTCAGNGSGGSPPCTEGALSGGGGDLAIGGAGPAPPAEGGTTDTGEGGAGAEGGAGGAGAEGGSDPAIPPQNPPSICDRADVVVCEDFEATPEGSIPQDFTNTGRVGVASDQAHGGVRSLRIEPEPNGPRRINLARSAFEALGSEQWGRIFFRVQLPHPVPRGGVIHSTLVAGTASSPLGDPIEVRVVDTVLDANGNHQYLYNVQPQNRGEFGQGSTYDYRYSDTWTCAEWHLDASNQVYEFFVDGARVDSIVKSNGPGNYDGTEIPERFDSWSFGWSNYQTADSGFTAWIDDIALASSRIGCEP